ncbi:hypothetical protein DRP07_01300 [Archaeoglobales archaeon]|nr:MAG: hypothetical protein DRP07_01300 [Archaeoglobales archaeon]
MVEVPVRTRGDPFAGALKDFSLIKPYSAIVFKVGDLVIAEDSRGRKIEKGDAAEVINSALEQGGKIFIKNGIYTIDSDLNITRSGVVIEGESRMNTILKAATGCTKIINIDDVQYTTIRDLRLQGEGIAEHCIYADTLNAPAGEGRITLENILAYNAQTDVIQIRNCAITRMLFVYAHTGRNALDIRDCQHAWIIGCDFEDATEQGVFTSNCEEIYFDDVKIADNGQEGIYISYQDKDIYMTNMRIANNGYHGVRIHSSVNGPILMDNIRIYRPSTAGANIYDGIFNGGCSKVIARGLVIEDDQNNMRYGINDAGNYNIYDACKILGFVTAATNLTGTGTTTDNIQTS